jgi:hypothetical protein
MSASQAAWEYVREGAAADGGGTLLGTTNSDWGQRAAQGHGLAIPAHARAILLAFIGNHASDPENGTATVKVTFYRSSGPAQLVQSLDLTFGGQRARFKPRRSTDSGALAKWAENIIPSAAAPTSYWISDPVIVGAAAASDNAACVAIKTYGAAYCTVEVTVVSAGITVDVLMAAIDEMP